MKLCVVIVVIFFVFSLIVCVGIFFEWDIVRKLQLGMIEKQVRELMGDFYLVINMVVGQCWVWSYGNGWGQVKLVVVIFKDGKIVEVLFILVSY